MLNKKEKLENELENRFGKSNQGFRIAAKEIGLLLHENKNKEAKLKFDQFKLSADLVLWEQLALSDCATLERMILEASNAA